MSGDPVKSLIEDLGTRLTKNGHSDIILNNGMGRQFEIKPSEFAEIKEARDIRRMAFVDGGNGVLEESPSFVITMNRVYFSMFHGRKRIKPKSNSRIQFFSYVTSNIHTADGEKSVKYDTKLFPYSDKDQKYLPTEADMCSATDRDASTIQPDSRLGSMGRKFAEWQLAIHAVESELQRGDMLVMDGSLQTTFKHESEYVDRLCKLALSKGIIVCGLAKTSRLITESGDPLLGRIEEIAEEVPFERWHVRVAERASQDDRGFMLAIKLHPNAQFVFRFEILREQFEAMDGDELNSVLYSLAANAQDVAMVGYPYGAIDADRFAQIRMDELDMYKGFIMSEMVKRPEWKKLYKYRSSLSVHDVLNRVTS